MTAAVVGARQGSGLVFLLLKWRAQMLLVLGLQQRALATFEDMRARWPDDAYVLASHASLRAQTGAVNAAISDLRKLVDAHPTDASGWFNLGFLLEQQGELADAQLAFTRAVDLDPKLDRAWYGLGLVLIRLDRRAEAITAFQRNTELQPMSPYGWYQMARAHMDLQQPEEALKILRHLKGFEPKVAAQLERETGLSASAPGTG